MKPEDITIVIPAKNEQVGLSLLLPNIKASCPGVKVIVVDDGSTDDTQTVAESNGCLVIRHPHSLGNGAAVKSGARAVETAHVVFMDGDGQHRIEDMEKILCLAQEGGYDLVVGQRDWAGQANLVRGVGNVLYNWLASKLTGYKIKDLTSGFRYFKADKLKKFLYLLPNGFSYPTTSTMAFMRVGYRVGFCSIKVERREGKSHLNIFRDGLKFFLIVFKIATLYSPMRIFFPVSLFFGMAGGVYAGYTLLFLSRFTNMSALLLSFSVVVFLIGLVSEQVSMLVYKGMGD